MKKVTKAVIPAAGLGTRFLPATKTIPKEMLPVVDQPNLLIIVEEIIAAGITDIVLVAGRQKAAIEDFFDTSYELEDKLEKSGKTDLLERVTRVKNLANIISIRQKEALGLGHAVYTAAPIIGDDPFALLLGDELMYTEPKQPTVIEQLVQLTNSTGLSTVAVMEVPEEDVKKYGICAVENKNGHMMVKDVVEKPQPSEAPSRWAIPGRYVFSSKIFDYLRETKPGKNGEIQLTDGMTQLAVNQGLIATSFTGQRYDTGDKFGYLRANIEYGLRHPEVGEALKQYLKDLKL